MELKNKSFPTENQFKSRLLDKELLLGGWASMGSTVATEILGLSGLDWVLIDGEHGANDHSSCVHQLLALNNGPAAAFIRPEANNPILLKRLLDFGFYNFIIPMVENREQAIEAVRATRYPPAGIRGVSVTQRSNRFGLQDDYFSKINDSICVVAQIESQLAVENIQQIASVPGIDCLFIGPQDLAASLGFLANPAAPEVQSVIRSLIDSIHAHNKPIGILVANEEEARKFQALGVTFIGISSDQAMIKRGAQQIVKAMRS
jgi:2-dehydro-3-deoxyglucarate aldolase